MNDTQSIYTCMDSFLASVEKQALVMARMFFCELQGNAVPANIYQAVKGQWMCA